MARPNILFITADQQRADCIGIEGRNIKTPHLDDLCREGTRFSSAITPCVVCQPARASILTGQLPRTHGVHDNGIDLSPEIGEKGFAGTLSAVGYNTGFFGKAAFFHLPYLCADRLTRMSALFSRLSGQLVRPLYGVPAC